MFTPEEQQVEICALKSDLEEIGDELLNVQCSSLNELEAKHNKKRRKTLSYVKNVRSIDDEAERLKLGNVQLTAQLLELKRQIGELTDIFETARNESTKIAEALKHEEQETETIIRKYEDSLQEKAERFRKSHKYYNKEVVNKEIDEVNCVIAELMDQKRKIQRTVEQKKAKLEAMKPDIPDNFLDIFGKLELDGKLKSLTEKLDELKNTK